MQATAERARPDRREAPRRDKRKPRTGEERRGGTVVGHHSQAVPNVLQNAAKPLICGEVVSGRFTANCLFDQQFAWMANPPAVHLQPQMAVHLAVMELDQIWRAVGAERLGRHQLEGVGQYTMRVMT
jgi:hypothetical protein